MFLLVCELHDILITLALKVVNLNDGLENGEAVLDVCEVIVSVDVNTVNLDLITWAGDINKIMEDEDFLLSWDTAGWDCAWGLLNGQLLVVAVDCLDLIDSEGAISLAHNTATKSLSCFIWITLIYGSLSVTAHALEEHFGVLGEDCSALRDYTLKLDKSVQMNLSQLSELVFNGQFVDAHINLLVELLCVIWVDFLHDLVRHLVKDRQHVGRLFCKPNG